jgi:hypothetical protein
MGRIEVLIGVQEFRSSEVQEYRRQKFRSLEV